MTWVCFMLCSPSMLLFVWVLPWENAKLACAWSESRRNIAFVPRCWCQTVRHAVVGSARGGTGACRGWGSQDRPVKGSDSRGVGPSCLSAFEEVRPERSGEFLSHSEMRVGGDLGPRGLTCPRVSGVSS